MSTMLTNFFAGNLVFLTQASFPITNVKQFSMKQGWIKTSLPRFYFVFTNSKNNFKVDRYKAHEYNSMLKAISSEVSSKIEVMKIDFLLASFIIFVSMNQFILISHFPNDF